ncbi:MAG TPA: hypothetical protein VHM30_15000, partial [Gemmatimonadaceae bacterium]|nr:hypothetical protein [Gemmatimonadaceae bacterium]
MAERLLDRLLRPKIVFGTLIVVVIVANLFLPDADTDDASGTLSSLSYERSGIRGWYEGSSRLGWTVKRREERFHGTLADSAVYVVVDPDIEPTAAEVGVLLGAVRRGAGLIVSAQRRSPLADSLRLYSDDWQYSGYPVVGGAMPAGPLPRNAVLATAIDTAGAESAAFDDDDAWVGDPAADSDSASADSSEIAKSEAR